ncbi:MAG: hypothetical protein ACX930_11515 [Erythrobacter sp.]
MVLDKLVSALKSGQKDVLLEDFNFETEKQNQLLYFIKPEVFLLEAGNAEKVCRLMWSTFERFGLEVGGAYLMSAEKLREASIMDRHYGFINQMSRTASTSLDDSERQSLFELCEVEQDTPILGGHEVLAVDPSFSAKSLDELWATKKSKRLKSGFYVESFDIADKRSVVVNGFHPYQLEHFTGAGREICLILVNSDLPWAMLRQDMLGDTFPEKADENSIRGHLNRNAAAYGFDEVTIANNCAHMSAGPFEAAFEFKNFLSDILPNFSLSSLRLGRHFESVGLKASQVEDAIGNPASDQKSVSESLFDLSEERDALSSSAVYARFFN